MGNKNYNNFYNGNRNHNNDVPNVETPDKEVKEKEIENVNDTIVESTDPSTVETTPIPGINGNSEETVSNELESGSEEENEESQNDSNVDITENEESKNDNQSVRVMATRLNVRKEPSKDSAIVEVVNQGDTLMLMNSEVVNGFYSVVTNAGEQGYCMQEFVELV